MVVGIGRRSPELTGHARPIWRVQLGQGGGPGARLPEGQEAWGGETGGPRGTHREMGGDGAADGTSFSFHVFFLHLRKSRNEAACGIARLIVSFWPLREEGGKNQIIGQGPFKELLF